MKKRIAIAMLAMVFVLAASVTSAEAGCVTCGSRGGVLGCVSASNGGDFCTITLGICQVVDACPSAGGNPQPRDLQPKVDPRLQANWLLNPRGLAQETEIVEAEVLS